MAQLCGEHCMSLAQGGGVHLKQVGLILERFIQAADLKHPDHESTGGSNDVPAGVPGQPAKH